MHKPPVPVRIIVALIVLGTIGYFGRNAFTATDTSQLTASGTIETVTINIAPETPGKVKDVFVEEGQAVRKGDPLLSLDDSLLSAQRAVASAQADSATASFNTAIAAYATAQQQYNVTLDTALAAERTSRTAVWTEASAGGFELPSWYFARGERLTAAQAEVTAAQLNMESAFAELDEIQKGEGLTFLETESALAQARAAYQNAKTVYDRTSNASDGQDLRDAAQTQLDDAELALEDAQSEYDDALSTDAAEDVLSARAKWIITVETYNTAVDNYRALQTGLDSPAVVTAGKALDQAKAAMEQAQAAVNTAKANLDLIDAQIAKLTLYAPMDGVVLVSNVEPGEFVQPGAVTLTLADLNSLTITVYVPNPRLNEVSVGQQATLTIDTASGESPTFTAEIVHIAGQAEFTPRNVQTAEGRASTVFAVKLKIIDPNETLKIGMPAEVVFK